MLKGVLSDGPCPYRDASFLDLNPLWVVFPKREPSSLPSPQLSFFLKASQSLAEDVVKCLQCDLPDERGVNHLQHMTVSAGWTEDGNLMVRVERCGRSSG